MSTVMRQVLLSATEEEVGAPFYGCQDAVPLCNTLADLGHVQGATLIITDNECCKGILNNTVKQRRSKAMDMQFYWVKCRIRTGTIQIIVAIWPRKSRRLLHKTERTSASQNDTTALRNQITYVARL